MNLLFPECQHNMRTQARLRAVRGPEELPAAVWDLLRGLSVAEQQRLLETEPLSARLEATLAALQASLELMSASGPARQHVLH